MTVSAAEQREAVDAHDAAFTREALATNPRRFVSGAIGVGLGVGIVLLLDGIWSRAEVFDRRSPKADRVAWATVHGNLDVIKDLLDQGASVMKIHEALEARGIVVPHRTLHLYARCHAEARVRHDSTAGDATAVPLAAPAGTSAVVIDLEERLPRSAAPVGARA